MSKITFDDKVDFQIWKDVPDKNKVKADDVNEIKRVVNENDDTLIKEKGKVDQLQQEIESYQNSLPRETLSGEYITMQNTADKVRFKDFVLGGNSKQEAEPSPEYPSKIENVEGDVEVTVANKNIANANEIWNNMHNFKPESCYLLEDEGRDCIRFSNSAFRPSGVEPAFNLINYKYKENTQYTIKMEIKPTSIPESGSGAVSIQILYTDGTTSGISKSASQTDGKFTEFRTVSTANKTIERIGFSYGTSLVWLLDKNSVFIAESDTTDYVPNEQQTITFPLEEGQKLYKGDYLADDGIHHKRTQIELDGTEYWFIGEEGTNTQAFGFVKSDKQAGEGLCNKFKMRNSGISIIDEEFCQTNATGNIIYIKINKNRLTTVDVAGFKTYLAEQKQAGTPVIVEYELAEEEIEPYTTEQQEAHNKPKELTTYAGQTNIYSTNNISPIFKVTGIKDTNAVLESMNAEVESIKELLSTTATSAMLLDNMQTDLESEVM